MRSELAYTLNGDIYCASCAPLGSVETTTSESDCPQHCAGGVNCENYMEPEDGYKCGYLFRHNLTTDGVKYVKDAHEKHPTPITEMWLEHYDIVIKDEDEDALCSSCGKPPWPFCTCDGEDRN